ncbi:hypothetical protein JKP88DRAFT_245529 [Tribonema minus]|uniref:Uncharacterized protein n=1 Tax=Tribonema minus TaxID=303371 RepID=A0A836CE36_9STRA|nr:hypothetical protein JKP88DRAFT_245529 [Tribonema minus]
MAATGRAALWVKASAHRSTPILRNAIEQPSLTGAADVGDDAQLPAPAPEPACSETGDKYVEILTQTVTAAGVGGSVGWQSMTAPGNASEWAAKVVPVCASLAEGRYRVTDVGDYDGDTYPDFVVIANESDALSVNIMTLSCQGRAIAAAWRTCALSPISDNPVRYMGADFCMLIPAAFLRAARDVPSLPPTYLRLKRENVTGDTSPGLSSTRLVRVDADADVDLLAYFNDNSKNLTWPRPLLSPLPNRRARRQSQSTFPERLQSTYDPARNGTAATATEVPLQQRSAEAPPQRCHRCMHASALGPGDTLKQRSPLMAR